MNPPIVLGSSSRYRAGLLRRLGLEFEQLSPSIDETPQGQESAKQLVARLAIAKGQAVAALRPQALVISSDQAAGLEGDILGKPGTPERACAQLARLSGQTVSFYTSLRVWDGLTGRSVEAVDRTDVQFRTLNDEMIADYVAREEPLDCAGAFKSEGLGVALFERIRSDDPTALIGLPLIPLAGLLADLGYPVLGPRSAADGATA